MSERQGVEIDYCPKCRGVWLDKGELDKIIEKSAAYDAGSSTPAADPFYDQRDRPGQYGKQDPYYGKHDPHYRRKKKGFLGDLFDFD